MVIAGTQVTLGPAFDLGGEMTTFIEVSGITLPNQLTELALFGVAGGAATIWCGGYRVNAKVAHDLQITPDHRAETQVASGAVDALETALRAKYEVMSR